MSKRLKDFPPGPLDLYRKTASFDWRKLKIFLDSEELIEFEIDTYEEFRKNGLLNDPNSVSLPFEEERKLAQKRMLLFKENFILSFEGAYNNLRKPYIQSITKFLLDPSAAVKYSIAFGMVLSVIKSLGTNKHTHYLEDIMNGKILGCFCLTEIGHGTNIKGMRTTSSYDKETKGFILNSPDFEAAKCWAGNLGKTATHAVVYAQLITPDGVNHGLHAFIVKVRDPNTLLPYPGITVGDMGEKIGLNGIDNGFILFHNYYIPRDNLLNRTGDVTEDGKYISPFKDPSKRHGVSLGALSVGRVNIINIGNTYLMKAIIIAIRYAAVRKQFGPHDTEEIPILEYPVHQHRLLPYLAVFYVHRIFSAYLFEVQSQFLMNQLSNNTSGLSPELGMELHAVSSAAKPLTGWLARDGIQECREACAGHGYLKVAGFSEIKNNHDANNTYEGENHVLIQQTSNWLLKFWPAIVKGKSISSPLGSVNFLSKAQQILAQKLQANSIDELLQSEVLLNVYKWLTCYLLKSTYEKIIQLEKFGSGQFWSKNESQVFYARQLSIFFMQHFILQVTYDKITTAEDKAIRNVLTRLFSLYAVWNLEKCLPYIFKGGYDTSGKLVELVQDAIIKLCAEIKNDAVSLVDAVAPPDFVLNSVLGSSDGQVYQHLQSSLLHSPNNLSRPSWWKEIVHWKENIKSKL